MITTGSTSSDKVIAAEMTVRPEAESARDDAQTQDAVDDGRDGGEVLDVDSMTWFHHLVGSAYSSR